MEYNNSVNSVLIKLLNVAFVEIYLISQDNSVISLPLFLYSTEAVLFFPLFEAVSTAHENTPNENVDFLYKIAQRRYIELLHEKSV